LGGVIFLELQVAGGNAADKPVGLDSMRFLSDDSRRAIRGAIARLRQLALADDLHTATDAAEVLATICLLCGESAGAEQCLDRVLRLNPSLEGAWDLRIRLLLDKPDRKSEIVAICQERLKHKESARNFFLLAKAYDEAHRPDDARRMLEAALLKEPDDFNCNLGLCALLMRRDNAAAMQRAAQLLLHAKPIWEKQRTLEGSCEFYLLTFAYAALTGELDSMRAMGSLVKDLDMFDERFREFESIVGPDLLLAPPPGVQLLPASGSPK
jgi:tetratricopeptide (TPR) repeat protein